MTTSGQLIGAILAVAMTCASSANAQTAAPAAPQTEVERAVQEYAAKLEADQGKLADTTAKNRAADLLRNPASPVVGNPNGDTTIVAFTDYQCPFCKAAEPRVIQLLKDDGNVRFVVKDFPILGPASVVASKAALAARLQGKHDEFHLALMAHKGQLQNEIIFDTAKNVGLDVDKLKKDMDAPEIADQLLANMNLARAMKISVVPGYIVDDHVLSGLTNKTQTSKINFTDEVAAARTRRKQ
ncbi:MAG: DsbA family protein [Rhodospirillaceae bacterium]|nr:DsbA family protein [Rhodospirillaceae bacterium]